MSCPCLPSSSSSSSTLCQATRQSRPMWRHKPESPFIAAHPAPFLNARLFPEQRLAFLAIRVASRTVKQKSKVMIRFDGRSRPVSSKEGWLLNSSPPCQDIAPPKTATTLLRPVWQTRLVCLCPFTIPLLRLSPAQRARARCRLYVVHTLLVQVSEADRTHHGLEQGGGGHQLAAGDLLQRVLHGRRCRQEVAPPDRRAQQRGLAYL